MKHSIFTVNSLINFKQLLKDLDPEFNFYRWARNNYSGQNGQSFISFCVALSVSVMEQKNGFSVIPV